MSKRRAIILAVVLEGRSLGRACPPLWRDRSTARPGGAKARSACRPADRDPPARRRGCWWWWSGRSVSLVGRDGRRAQRVSHPPRRVWPMQDRTIPSESGTREQAGAAAGLGSGAFGRAGPDGSVGGPGRPDRGFGRCGRIAQFISISHTCLGQVLALAHPADRVCSMNDLPNPTEALALDPAGAAAEPSAPAIDQPGLPADGRTGEAGGRAGDAPDPTLPADGRAIPGDGLAGGRAAGVAGGPAGAVGQSDQPRSKSDFSNGCDCHTKPIGCTA